MAPWHDEALWQDGTEGLVILPDGRRLRGRGLRNACPAAGVASATDGLPDFGLYLTGTSAESLTASRRRFGI